MSTRRATHANSWYSGDKNVLNSELDGWLSAVGDEIEGVGRVPFPGARIIIAPHAGYSYSGPAAAYAYKSWDLSKATRIFILGPSHHIYLDTLALTTTRTHATPLGPLTVDTQTIQQLHATGKFKTVTKQADEAEHSLEMHLPYIYKSLERFGKLDTPIVPIMVGAVGAAKEKMFGSILKPWLESEENAFVVSTDFCHWGTRFDYTHYYPTLPTASVTSYPPHLKLSARSRPPVGGPAIYESITALDKQGMAAVSTGRHNTFVEYLHMTKNTVCGRHPIGVIMAGIEAVLEEEEGGEEEKEGRGMFKWVRYEHSSEVEDVRESSVSYASAFCVL